MAAKKKSSGQSEKRDDIMLDNLPWFEKEPEEMGKEVDLIIEGYKTEQSGRRTRYIRNLERYERRPMGGYSAHSYYNDGGTESFEDDRLGLLRSGVSSAVSSLYANQKPKPQFQTMGADWETRRKAYKLDRTCECILNQRQGPWINMWAFTIDAGVETGIQGVACIKVTSDLDNKRIDHKLIPHPDIFFDPAQGRDPWELFHREPIDQIWALRKWKDVPGAADAIRNAKDYEFHVSNTYNKKRACRVVELKFAYKLPDHEGAKGKWCAVINGVVVDSGEWNEPTFPFVFLKWEPHRDGPWASGLADESGDQVEELSDLDARFASRARIAAKKRTYYQEGTVRPDDLAANDEEVIIAVTADAKFMPVPEVTPPFTETEMKYFDAKTRAVWDTWGISQVSAAARREQGVQSGIAMMTLNDTKAGRQLVKAQRYEQLFVDLAHQWIRRLREINEAHKGFKLKWRGKNMMREMVFAECDVADDLWSVIVAPASNLPHDPAGRQEMVQQLFNAEMISKDTARQLIGWPDLDAELQIDNSETEYIDMLIEKYLDANEKEWTAADYQAPEGFLTNKIGAIRRFSAAWFRTRIDQSFLPKAEQIKADFNLQLLTRYIKELDDLMQKAAAAAAALQATATGGPPDPNAPMPMQQAV